MARLFQFSIRSLLVAVTIAAVGIAALLNANGWWEAAVWLAALFILAAAVLLVVYRRDQTRAFWLGFTVFGGMYLALLLFPFSNNVFQYNSLVTTKLLALVYEALPDSRRQDSIPAPVQAASWTDATFNTSYAVDALTASGVEVTDSAAPPGASGSPAAGNVAFGTTPYSSGSSGPIAISIGIVPPPATIPNPKFIPPGNFISIGQALWLLLIAAIGGKVCQLIYRTRPQTEN
jgi:hypothetical protein